MNKIKCNDEELKDMYARFAKKCMFKMKDTAQEKDRPLDPWNCFDYSLLISRLDDEVEELSEALFNPDKTSKDIMDECKDVANFAMFIYQKALIHYIEECTNKNND